MNPPWRSMGSPYRPGLLSPQTRHRHRALIIWPETFLLLDLRYTPAWDRALRAAIASNLSDLCLCRRREGPAGLARKVREAPDAAVRDRAYGGPPIFGRFSPVGVKIPSFSISIGKRSGLRTDFARSALILRGGLVSKPLVVIGGDSVTQVSRNSSLLFATSPKPMRP